MGPMIPGTVAARSGGGPAREGVAAGPSGQSRGRADDGSPTDFAAALLALLGMGEPKGGSVPGGPSEPPLWSGGAAGLSSSETDSPSASELAGRLASRMTMGTPPPGEVSAAGGVSPAGEAPSAAETAAPTRADRDLDRVDPELARRVERVVERMRDEYGHDVQVVEGFRSQARQDLLYAQGRGRPGPVVTWTRASEHTRGRAVDVQLDGTWRAPDAYARLQQVARQEGLATLGARDPGHLELPASVVGRDAPTTEASASGPTAAPRPAPGAGLAETAADPAGRPAPEPAASPDKPAPPLAAGHAARVARVARVASVAGVARIARPGSGSRAAPTDTPPSETRARTAPAAGARAQGGPATRATTSDPPPSEAVARAATVERRRDGPASSESDARDGASSDARTRPGEAAPAPGRHGGDATGPARSQAAPGSTASARAAQVRDMQEAVRASGNGAVRVELPDVDGHGTRLRMGVRAGRVDATLEMRDAHVADRVRARVDELHRSLEHRGIETDAVRVKTVESRGEPAPVSARPAVAESAAGRDSGSTGGRSDTRDGAWTDGGRQQRERSRRDPKREEPR